MALKKATPVFLNMCFPLLNYKMNFCKINHVAFFKKKKNIIFHDKNRDIPFIPLTWVDFFDQKVVKAMF